MYIPKILIVDDNPINVHLAKTILASENVELLVANSGERAIVTANETNPDLILLDIMMPIIDGYEVCQRLKSNEKTKDIPVIFLTAKSSKEDIVKSFKMGAVDFVIKPFNAEELILRVRTHLTLKLQKQEIEEKNSILESLIYEKNELLGITAHDLKNPISNINMIAKIILNDDNLSKSEINDFCKDIISLSTKMSDLIRNLLNINAIEQGKIKINLEQIDLNTEIKGMVKIYKDKAKEKDIEIVYNETKNIIAYTDQAAAVQIIDNLLSNAIKFSPFSKKVYISLIESDNYITFSIKDEGPGFSESDKLKLWGKFARLSATPTNNENSTGLGLSIVKKYVELCNAEINLISNQGEGAEFLVKFKKPS